MTAWTCLPPHWQAVWTRSRDASGHLPWGEPGVQPAIGCRGKCLRVPPNPPACSHPLVHSTRKPTQHTQQIWETWIALVRGLCCLSRFEKDVGNRMRLENEDYLRKRVHIRTSFEPLLWTEFKGQCSLKCKFSVTGKKFQHSPPRMEWMVCARTFSSTISLPSFKTRCLTKILDLIGIDAGNMERMHC